MLNRFSANSHALSGMVFKFLYGLVTPTTSVTGLGQRELQMQWTGRAKKEFTKKKLKPYKVQGVQKAAFKSVDNLHYARVFNAGHNVWWYRKYNVPVARTLY